MSAAIRSNAKRGCVCLHLDHGAAISTASAYVCGQQLRECVGVLFLRRSVVCVTSVRECVEEQKSAHLFVEEVCRRFALMN